MSALVARDVLEVDGRRILVSTLNRESSSMINFGTYAETLVVLLGDDDKWVRIIEQDESPEDSVRGHERMVAWVKAGMPEDDEQGAA